MKQIKELGRFNPTKDHDEFIFVLAGIHRYLNRIYRSEDRHSHYYQAISTLNNMEFSISGMLKYLFLELRRLGEEIDTLMVFCADGTTSLLKLILQECHSDIERLGHFLNLKSHK